MALPVSRTKTLVEGDVIESALVNDIQDAIVALYGGSKPSEYHDVPFMAFRPVSGSPYLNNPEGLLELPEISAVELDLALPQNAALHSVRARVRGNDEDATLRVQLGRRRDEDTIPLSSSTTGGSDTEWGWVADTPSAVTVPYQRPNEEDVLVVQLACLTGSGTSLVKISKIQIRYSIP